MTDTPTDSEDQQTTDEDDAFRLRDPLVAAAAEAFEERITELVEKAVSGESIDVELAEMMEEAPDAVRAEIVKRFREVQQEIEGRGEALEVTPEMEAKERELREREQSKIAMWLSKKTLEKIRRALLSNPALFYQVMSVGEELTKKGVFLDTQRQQVSNADIGAVVVQPDLAQNKDKEKDSSRSR